MRWMGPSTVGVKCDWYFRNPLVSKARLDYHLRRELHAGAPLVEALIERLREAAHATVHVVHRHGTNCTSIVRAGC
jgi:hypothetical protein